MTPPYTPDTPFLSIRNMRIEVARSGAPLIEDLSYDLHRGEFLAVVGESGSGKTMAARAIMRLLPAGIACTRGEILLDGEDLLKASAPRMHAMRGGKIGMVFQEPMVSLNPAHRIGDQMSEGMRIHTKLTKAEIRQRCVEMLKRVQIRDPEHCLNAYPHEFSGGMRQRIMLASVMMLRPKLLIADEPTTALDTLTQREVLDLMVTLAREEGTAVLLITHNLGLVARYAQRAIVLEKGRFVETGDVHRILRAPQTAYTRQLVEALPKRGDAVVPTSNRNAIIQVRDLAVTYRGNRTGLFKPRPAYQAIDGLDLDIHEGETVAVVGGSGSGKTTLGRAILRLVPAAHGKILYRGRDVLAGDRASLHAFRMACQLVFQDPHSSLNPRMRVRDIVAEPLRHCPMMNAQARRQRIDETLDEVSLGTLASRFPHELSGGQRQRVAIARALVRRPAFVVADEPVSALDMTIQAQVLKLFQTLQQRYGFACLFISHDLAAVEQIADRVVVMEQGKIVEQGLRDEIYDRPQHAYTKSLLEAAPQI